MLVRPLLLALAAMPAWAGVPATCPAGSPIGLFELEVKPPNPGPSIPLPAINRIEPGSALIYRPGPHPFANLKDARVAMILVPADKSPMEVLDPQPAGTKAEWPVNHPLSVVALVWGPNGLDKGKMESLVTKNGEVIEQLADYASKTEQMEGVLEALSGRSGNPTQDVDVTLSAFGTQYSAATRLDRSGTLDQQTLDAIRSLNPAIASYDPLAPQGSQRLQQSAGLAASVAGLFFGTGVGLAAGGGALFVNLRTLFFPRSEFRAAFTQKTGPDQLVMCGKPGMAQARTRVAFLWAARIANASAPDLSIQQPAHAAIGVTSPVAMRIAKGEWSQILRVHGWTLVQEGTGKEWPASISADKDKKTIELNLAGSQVVPGDYHLRAKWDWDDLPIAGEIHIHGLTNLAGVRLTPQSQDTLIAGAGRILIELEGADFEFVQKLELKNPRERYTPPVTVNFTLPQGLRAGPQPKFEAEIDTRDLKAGLYQLRFTQVDGKTHETTIKVLQPPPRLTDCPLRFNLGEDQQRVVLTGTGLDRIEKIDAGQVAVALAPPEGEDRRTITVRLSDRVRKGDRIAFQAKVRDMDAPLMWKNAAEIVGPRPRIGGIETSLPAEAGVGLKPGELPSGGFVSFVLSARNFTPSSVLTLGCAEDSFTLHPLKIHVGEQDRSATLRIATPESLFLSVDPASVGQSGCTLSATLSNEVEGSSDAKTLGRIVRLPRIESFQLTGEKAGEAGYVGILKGQDLELIAKTGWDTGNGVPVTALPAPVAGDTLRQSLKVVLPWPAPAPHAPLYIWLRGEIEGRATAVQY